MLKIITAIVVAIGFMIGIVALVGSRLPVGHIATRSVVIDAVADSVFDVVTDFEAAPAWRSGLSSASVSTDSATGRRRVTETGSNGTMSLEVEQLVRPSRLVTRIVGNGLPYGGAWAYQLDRQGNATRITITEHGEVYNPVFRFVSRYLIGHTATLETYLTDLGRRFGAAVVPADAAPVPVP